MHITLAFHSKTTKSTKIQSCVCSHRDTSGINLFFFVISGFICCSLCRARASTKAGGQFGAYFYRWLTRLEPP